VRQEKYDKEKDDDWAAASPMNQSAAGIPQKWDVSHVPRRLLGSGMRTLVAAPIDAGLAHCGIKGPMLVGTSNPIT